MKNWKKNDWRNERNVFWFCFICVCQAFVYIEMQIYEISRKQHLYQFLPRKNLITARFSCWHREDHHLDVIQTLSFTDEPKALLVTYYPMSPHSDIPLFWTGIDESWGRCALRIPVSVFYLDYAATIRATRKGLNSIRCPAGAPALPPVAANGLPWGSWTESVPRTTRTGHLALLPGKSAEIIRCLRPH